MESSRENPNEFFYSSSQELKKRNRDNIHHNLKQFNCTKRIFNGQGETMYGIAEWNNFVFTSSRGAIKAWNINTGESVWDYSDNLLYLGEKLWIADGKVICAGRKNINKNSFQYNKMIFILDAENGTCSSINEPYLQTELVTVIDNKIIAKLQNGKINCWNTSGQLIKSYQGSAKNGLIPRLLANEHYLADINDQIITIINRNNGELVNITAPDRIYSAVMTNNLLVCGSSGIDSSRPDITIIDMEKNEIIDHYKTMGLLDYRHPTYGTHPNAGSILSVTAKDKKVFMSHESGTVVAVNLLDHSHQVLETLPPHGPYLTLRGNYLFILSTETTHNYSSLHIWDIEKMEKIRSMEIHDLQTVKWHKGDLLLATGNSLVKYDFKVLHQQGELLAEGSPEALEVDVCTIM